jgi:hypothetical protein
MAGSGFPAVQNRRIDTMAGGAMHAIIRGQPETSFRVFNTQSN